MDDLINRQAAIKALRKGKPKETEYRGSYADSRGIGKLLQYESDISAVIALPSAQTEEAIPIAWLEEQARWFENMDNAFAKIEANNIRVMIKKWRGEKDERPDKQTGGD